MTDSYDQYFCPISRAAEIFATRWTPIIVRNMLVGCKTFSEMREMAPGIPRSLLTERLKQLEHAGLIERRPKVKGRGWLYELTPMGRELESEPRPASAAGESAVGLAAAVAGAGVIFGSCAVSAG